VSYANGPRPPWSWPMRILMTTLCLIAFVLFAYVMLKL
jgi:hypothetical protein